MIIDLPDTSVGALSKRLLSLRDDVGAMALGRVLTLVVVVDEARVEQALTVASRATHQHPSRIVTVVHSTRRGTSRLDGQIRVGGDAGASEIVVMRLFGELNRHGESVVLPLLLPDSPIVVWWPYDAPKDVANDPIGRLGQRRITDAEHSDMPARTIAGRAATYADGDTDLVWTRTTKWRGILAAALDQPPYEPVTTVVVSGGYDSASTDLLAGWLGYRLSCPVIRARSEQGTGLLSVRLDRKSGPIELVRPDGLVAVLADPGQPVRRMALARRTDEECLADELARLDPDEIYEETLKKGLPLLRGKHSLPLSEAVEKGLAPALSEARKVAAELQRDTSSRSAAAMVEREAPSEKASQPAVEKAAASQRKKVAAARRTDPPQAVSGRKKRS